MVRLLSRSGPGGCGYGHSFGAATKNLPGTLAIAPSIIEAFRGLAQLRDVATRLATLPAERAIYQASQATAATTASGARLHGLVENQSRALYPTVT